LYKSYDNSADRRIIIAIDIVQVSKKLRDLLIPYNVEWTDMR